MTIGILRPIKDSELELMLSWRNAPQVRANMYSRHEIGLAEHLAWWGRIKENPRFLYSIYEFNGLPMGVVAFTDIDFANQNSSWAFYAAPDAPKGTGSRMEFLALEQAFGVMLLHKLHCEVLEFNKAVIGLHQKFGFKSEGVFREHHKVNDVFVNVHRMGILSSEWIMRRTSVLEKITAQKRG